MIFRYLLIWDKGLEFERFHQCWGSQTSPWGPHLWHSIVTNSTATEPTKQRDSRISTRCWAPDDTKGARIEGGRAIFSRKNLHSCTTKKKACGWHPTNPIAQRPIHRLKKRVATYNLLSWLFELTPLQWRTLTANIVAWPCHLLVQMVPSGLPQLSQNVARKVLLKNSPWTNSMINEAPNNPAIGCLRLAPQRKDQKTAKWPGSCFFPTDGEGFCFFSRIHGIEKGFSNSTFWCVPFCNRNTNSTKTKSQKAEKCQLL